jgi:hypothetical protein
MTREFAVFALFWIVLATIHPIRKQIFFFPKELRGESARFTTVLHTVVDTICQRERHPMTWCQPVIDLHCTNSLTIVSQLLRFGATPLTATAFDSRPAI